MIPVLFYLLLPIFFIVPFKELRPQSNFHVIKTINLCFVLLKNLLISDSLPSFSKLSWLRTTKTLGLVELGFTCSWASGETQPYLWVWELDLKVHHKNQKCANLGKWRWCSSDMYHLWFLSSAMVIPLLVWFMQLVGFRNTKSALVNILEKNAISRIGLLRIYEMDLTWHSLISAFLAKPSSKTSKYLELLNVSGLWYD